MFGVVRRCRHLLPVPLDRAGLLASVEPRFPSASDAPRRGDESEADRDFHLTFSVKLSPVNELVSVFTNPPLDSENVPAGMSPVPTSKLFR